MISCNVIGCDNTPYHVVEAAYAGSNSTPEYEFYCVHHVRSHEMDVNCIDDYGTLAWDEAVAAYSLPNTRGGLLHVTVQLVRLF